MEAFDNFWAVYSNLVLTLGTNSLLALSIYLPLSCGMLAMANAAFMGIGAYAAALLTMNFDAPFTLALAGGMAAPACPSSTPACASSGTPAGCTTGCAWWWPAS